MAFSNTFTGHGTGIILPSGEGLQRSQEKMDDMILASEKIRQETFQKNKDEFLKSSHIDPVYSLSKSAMESQAKALDFFNKKWGKVFQDKGGNLSMEDQTAMAADKGLLTASQAEMKASMDKYLQDRAYVQKDMGKTVDVDDWMLNGDKQMRESGRYDYQLQPKGVSLGDWYNTATHKVNGTPGNVTVIKPIGGVQYKETYQSSGTEAEGRTRVEQDILGNDGIAKQTIREFLSLKEKDPVTYKKYLDINNDGTVSPDEERQASQVSNPILKWAKDTYWQQALDIKLGAPTKLNTASSGSGGNMKTWQGQKYTPTSAMVSPYPGLQSKTYHPIANLAKQLTIPVSEMELLEPDKEISDIEKPNQSIKGFVTGYDENSDKIIFMISQDYKDLDYPTLSSGRGMQVAVPRSAFSKEIFDDLEIVKDNKVTKLKDINTSKSTTTTVSDIPDYLKRSSGVTWK